MRLSFSVHHRVQFLLLLNKASGNELKISERPVLTTVLIESNHETYQPSRQRVDINWITTPELEPALFNNSRNCTSWGGPVLCFLVAYINLWRGGGSHAKTRNNNNCWNGGKLINLKTVTLLQLFWHSLLNGVSWYVRNVDSFAQSTIRLLGQSLPSVPATYLRYLR